MQAKLLLTTSLAALLGLTACDGGVAGVNPGDLSREDAVALAPDYAELADAEMAAFGVPTFDREVNADVVDSVTFNRVRSCPVSGSVAMRGTLALTANRETRSASHQLNATRTEQACAFTLRNRGVITVNGNPNTAVTGSWSVTNGVPGIRTLTQKGSFTWALASGPTGTCTVDLTATWDPATHTHRVQGTFCNRTVDVTRTRT